MKKESQSSKFAALRVVQAAIIALLGLVGAADLTDGQPLALVLLAVGCAATAWLAVRRPAEKRTDRTALVLGALFAVMLVIGQEVHHQQTIEGFVTVKTFLKALIRMVGLTGLCWAALRIVLRAAGRMHPVKRSGGPAFWKIWLAMFVCWLPYYICFFPGCLSHDSINELSIILGSAPLSNHHPIIHQWTIAPFVLLGQALGSLEWGVGLYSLFQMAAMSAIFAGVVRRLMEEGAARGVLAMAFLCYALVSVHAFYSITMWKDVLFGGLTVLAVMMLTRVAQCCEEPCEKGSMTRGRWLGLSVVLFLFCIYRNNGYYAFLLGFPVFLLCNRRLWKPLLVVGAAVLLMVNAYQWLIFDGLGAQKSAPGEALALPLQQIAKTVRDHNLELTREETEALEELFPSVEELRWAYDPTASDPVKAILRNDVLLSNPMRYLKLWTQLGLEHPLVYLDVLLYHTHGYWYPDVPYWSVDREIYPNSFGLVRRGTAGTEFLGGMYDRLQNTPLLGALCRPAPYVWIVLIAFAVLVSKRRTRLASPWVLLAGIWLTSMASPVFAEFRYMYGVVASMPFCVGIALTTDKRRM